MLVETSKAEVVPTHISAKTYNFFINMISTDRIFTTTNLSSLSDTAAALPSGKKKTLQHSSVAQSAAPKDLVLLPQWGLPFRISSNILYIYIYMPTIYIYIVYSFLLSAHFPCGSNIIFLTCKSPDCTSMDGE